MVATTQSMTVPPPVPATALSPARSLGVAVARRAMPLVTASATAALATLAAEQAVAGLAMRLVERTGIARPRPAELPAAVRVTVTRTVVVERITRRG